MAVDPERARALALALSGASEAPHFHRLPFRTPRRAFATLDAAARDLNPMFDPELRDFYYEQAPEAFAPVPGGWGRMGATRCDLRAVDEAAGLGPDGGPSAGRSAQPEAVGPATR